MNQRLRPEWRALESLEARRMLAVGGAYVLPPTPRVTINQDPGWKFALNPSGTPQGTSFNDSSWASVSLPHTWNNIDAASTNYASGDGWYRKTINIDSSLAGKRLLLDFEGAFTVTSLYIDGTQVDYKPASAAIDPHSGGFGEFLFDVTSRLTQGSHLIAVKVNSSSSGNLDTPPSNSGDYSRQGGLYRDVSLLAVPLTRIAKTENVAHGGLTGTDTATPIATSGVYFSNSNVVIGATSANVTIRTVLDNNQTTAPNVSVTSYLVDAAGVIQAQTTTSQTLGGSQTGAPITQNAAVANPHLWDGRIDPYLYDLYVEVRDTSTGTLLDTTHRKVGIRSFTINANASNSPTVAPFLLNGHRYTLVGADAHQDTGRRDANGNPYGWAQPDSTIQADVDLLMNAGATVIRTSHYQDNQAFYDYCDQVGMLVYTEISINGTVRTGDAFMTNAQDQYQELIRQTQNNPSVFAWGFGNETGDSTQARAVFTQLNNIAHAFDISRKTAFAQYGGSQSNSSNAEGIPDIKGTHRYDWWYINPEGTAGIQNVINAYPNQPVGVTEIGAGASAYQYADSFTLPVASQSGGVTTHYHPANQQALINEMQMTQYEPLNNLWARIIWQAFDHGSSGKNEGDQGGVNDKGLTTRDRTLKDSYYYFSALWNDPTRNYANRKVLDVGNKLWTTRNTASTQITVYSNLGAPTLSLNGTSLGVMTPLQVNVNNGVKNVQGVYVMNVTLPVGNNTITASRQYTDGQTYTNSANFAYYNAANFAKATPVVSGVAINRTFTYSPVFKTTSNPYNYALANGLYDVKITSPSGGANNLSLEGQTAAIDSNGLATADTFYARVNVTDGQLTIAGAPGAYNAAVTSIDISAVDITAPAVASTTINGGGVQRSRIESLGVTFTERVNLATAAVTLGLRNTAGTGYAATYDLTAANPSGDGKTFVLSLASGNPLTSLGDGVYDLIVNSFKVSDLSGNLMLANSTTSFYRLYGDIDGSNTVDFSDFLVFQNTFNLSQGTTGYVSGFDADNNDVIDFNDFLSLQNNFGKTTVVTAAPRTAPVIRLTGGRR